MAMLLNTGQSIVAQRNAQFQANSKNTHVAKLSELTNGPGFELTAFVDKEAISALLDQTGSEGIWIYPAVEVDLNDDLCMIAVGADTNRIELRDEKDNFCFCCYTDASKSTRQISIGEGAEMVNDRRPKNTIKNRAAFQDIVNNDRLKALFHREQVSKILEEPGDRIRLDIVDLNFTDSTDAVRTVAMTPADNQGVNQGDMMASLMPCPPSCPDDGGYL
ncbi:MAG: hypothetical protein AAF433_20670 [Bacteroidota bacterium]